jgi:hypothetical protein
MLTKLEQQPNIITVLELLWNQIQVRKENMLD